MKIVDVLRNDWPIATEVLKLESRLWQLVLKQSLRVVMVSSALRNEGKSTTVAYLATALAIHPGRKILAVDMDFRGPTMREHFEVTVQAGLADVLRGERGLQDAITATDLPGLQLLLPARDSESADPRLLHDTVHLHEIFGALRQVYDLILIDSPALVPVPDSTALVPLSDGVIMMAMAGRTSKHHLVHARELCLSMGANLLGLVVANVQEAAPEYLDARYYYGYSVHKNGGGS